MQTVDDWWQLKYLTKTVFPLNKNSKNSQMQQAKQLWHLVDNQNKHLCKKFIQNLILVVVLSRHQL